MKTTATAISVNGQNAVSAASAILHPYRVSVTLEGKKPILFHNYNCEAVEIKSNAVKGSKEKKMEDPEHYVYRTREGLLGLNSIMLLKAMALAAKSQTDPRSPRKSAHDLFIAGVVAERMIYPFHGDLKTWDYLDKQPVVVNMARVPRVRPALTEGWKITFILEVAAPQYVTPNLLHTVLIDAGRFQGLGDYRPVYGTFSVINFEILG